MSQKTQNYDYFLVLDFEATCEDNARDWPNEIIEFPTIALNARTLEIEHEFQVFVKPPMNPNLTPFCVELTGIQQEWVDNGVTLEEALHQHSLWLKNNKMDNAAFVTCGDWDLQRMLPTQCKRDQLPKPAHFNRWINIKKAFQKWYGTHAKGMVNMLHFLDIPLTGRHHSGIDDCRNIAKIVRRMATDGAVLEITGKCKK